MTCCLWCPYIKFADNKKYSPIKGIEQAEKCIRRMPYNQIEYEILSYSNIESCEICQLTFGYLIQCYQPGCIQLFHPICAQLSGNYLDFFNESSESNLLAYCGQVIKINIIFLNSIL